MPINRIIPSYVSNNGTLTVPNIIAGTQLTASGTLTLGGGATANLAGTVNMSGTVNITGSDTNIDGFECTDTATFTTPFVAAEGSAITDKVVVVKSGSNLVGYDILQNSSPSTARGSVYYDFLVNNLTLVSKNSSYVTQSQIHLNSTVPAISLQLPISNASIQLEPTYVNVNRQLINNTINSTALSNYLNFQAQSALDPGISFHKPNVFAANLFLSSSNELCWGGLSLGSVAYPILNTNNFVGKINNYYVQRISGAGIQLMSGLGLTTEGTAVFPYVTSTGGYLKRLAGTQDFAGAGAIDWIWRSGGGSFGVLAFQINNSSLQYFCNIDGLSDERFKQNIELTSYNALDLIRGLSFIDFEFIEDPERRNHCGLSAQNLQELDPELVIELENFTIENGEKTTNQEIPIKLMPDKEKLLYKALKAIQELDQQLQELKAQLQ